MERNKQDSFLVFARLRNKKASVGLTGMFFLWLDEWPEASKKEEEEEEERRERERKK